MNKIDASREIFKIIMDKARITNGAFAKLRDDKLSSQELSEKSNKEICAFRKAVMAKVSRQPFTIVPNKLSDTLSYVEHNYNQLSRESRMWLNPSPDNDYDCNLMILIRMCICTQGGR